MINIQLKSAHKKAALSIINLPMIFFLFISFFLALSSSSALGAPILQIKPITWDIIGLDSNNVTTGPDTFPVGARVCNTGDAPATNVTATFVFDNPLNGFFALQGNPTLTFSSLPSGPSFRDIGPIGPVPSNCADFYWNVTLTRNSAAYDTTQKYHIEVTADTLGVVSTPSNRELYVEHLVSQNRNGVMSITGPTTVYVGNTYQYTIIGKTATGGYEQLVYFLNFPNIIFQILDVSTTYSVPLAPNNINNATYADACGWDPNVGSPTYRSCIGPENYSGGKAGGDPISTTFTVKIISAGVANLTSLIYDFSGSSYHYNSDFGIDVLAVTALEPPLVIPPTIVKAFEPPGIVVNGTTSLSFTIQNDNTSTVLTGIGFSDTLPAGLIISTPNGLSGSCGGGTITATAGSSTISLSGASLAAGGTCTFSVSVTGTTAGVKSNTTGNVTSMESGPGGTAAASITVTAASPPTISKSFGAASIPLNGAASLSFTINNPNISTALTGIGFSDVLPAGLIISTPNGLTGSCGGGTITATAGSSTVSLSGGSLAASGTCTFSVNVTGTSVGVKNNTTDAVTSTEGGIGNAASASLTIIATTSTALVPTMTEWGMIIFMILAGIASVYHLRRKRRT